jgi:NitT/TauT family transport system substrate-binding protein
MRFFSVAGVLLLALEAFSADASAQTVKVSDLGVLADAPYYIGIEKGYFTAENIQIELQRFNSGQQAVAPLSVNQIQVVGGAVSAALFNAFARGWPVRIAMARARDVPNYFGNSVIVRKDLQATVKGLSDLKGRRIALNAPAASMAFMLGKMLSAGGLRASDVDITYMSWPNMGSAFSSKAIDAGTTAEPFTYRYSQQGLTYRLSDSPEVFREPSMEVAVLLYNKDWLERNPDQVKRFSVAFLRGARDFVDAMRGGAKRAEVVSILAKHTNVKDLEAYDRMGWAWMDPNGEVSAAGLADQQDWYAAQGDVPKKVPVAELIDRQGLDYALSKLGRLQ